MTTPTENGWQAIETAPKDGSTIVAFSDVPGHRGLSLIFWDAVEGWCGLTAEHEKKIVKFPPTHWAAIPAIPALPETNGGQS